MDLFLLMKHGLIGQIESFNTAIPTGEVRGCHHSISINTIDAPFSASNSTDLVCQFGAAKCSRVILLLSQALMSAPF